MNSYLDDKFRYMPAASHNDVRAFHRRQQARRREIEEAASIAKAKDEQTAREAAGKVRALRKVAT